MKFYFAIENIKTGQRTFDSLDAVDFDAAFNFIHRKDVDILSIGICQANVNEDVYCQDHDC